VTKAEKALIGIAVEWEKSLLSGVIFRMCQCPRCELKRAVRRVVKERRRGK
jgi:hypothetical protein